jgi:hypothetical protein
VDVVCRCSGAPPFRGCGPTKLIGEGVFVNPQNSAATVVAHEEGVIPLLLGPFIGDSKDDIVRPYAEYRARRFDRLNQLAHHRQQRSGVQPPARE